MKKKPCAIFQTQLKVSVWGNMDIKRVLSNQAPEPEISRFWLVSMAVGYGLMVMDMVVDAKFFAGFRGVTEDSILPLLAFVASLTALLSKTDVVNKARLATAGLTGLFLLQFVLAVPRTIQFFNWGDTPSVPALGFVLVVMSFPSVLASALSGIETLKSVSPTPSVSSAPRASGSPVSADAVLYTAIGGAAAVGLSLLALPWFALESFDWNDSVNITFNNLRDVYNYARDNGLDGDVRFFYLEWGYLVSYAVSVLAVIGAVQFRNVAAKMSVQLLGIAIGATCLVGLWQGAIATALTQLDDDGSVQFGVWLGVLGHVAIAVSFVMLRRGMRNRIISSTPGY